jgi:expansin (peptidoglycan-binding protein)
MQPQKVFTSGLVLVTALLVTACGTPGHEGIQDAPRGGKGSSQAPPLSVQVFVTKAPVTGGVMYRYTVANGSAFPITALLVGFDEYYGVPKLASEPVGWDGDSLPRSSYGAPSGWAFMVEPTEEDSLIDVKWVIEAQTGGIPGGQTVGGFTVVVAQADSTYDRGGMWTTYMRGESPVWGALQAK